MKRLKMHSIDKVGEHISQIAELFPHCVTERKNEEGVIESAIDFEKLKQELSHSIVDGEEERYLFSWPGKKESILLANSPVVKTLRPCRKESIHFDDTHNLYIEGDNLEVLKLLREGYLGAVKMIYIDPPYNTGKDFIYGDKYSCSVRDYLKYSGQFSEEGVCLVQNPESNGRFHTDWLNMMYPRIRLARDFLSFDGAIFISIGDREQAHVRKLCDEVFGELNRVAEFVVIRSEGGGMAKQVVKGHDYLFVYAKDIRQFKSLGRKKVVRGKVIFRGGEEYWVQEDWLRKSFGKYGHCYYEDILDCKGQEKFEEVERGLNDGVYVLIKKGDGKHVVGKLRRMKEDKSKFYSVMKHLSSDGLKDLKRLGIDGYFSYPKPVSLLKEIIAGMGLVDGDIVLDFFSGSGSSAEAVMQLNAEDGVSRKFIMVQVPEVIDCDSEAYRAGFRNICEIGRERIRRASLKIVEDNEGVIFDGGFRVLRCDSSNMRDIYYETGELNQEDLGLFVEHIKSDRSVEDLLFQVMLDLGVMVSSCIEERILEGVRVYFVDGVRLVACFEEGLGLEVLRAVAKEKPRFFVVRDSCLRSDSVISLIEGIFMRESPDTVIRVL